jgi:hypothetical protein
VVIVLSGVTPRERFGDYEPLAVLDNISQLPQLFS